MSCFRILDHNYLFDSSVDLTPSTEDTSFPSSNLRKFHRGRVWRTTSSTAQSLVIDLKTAEEVDTAVILFEPDTQLAFHAGQTIKIQANATNVWTSPAVDISFSLDETYGVLSKFWSTAEEYRYWRIYLDDPYSGYGYFELPKVFLGKSTLPNQPPSLGFKLVEKDQSRITDNDYGIEYADGYPARRIMAFDFDAISDSDRQTFAQIYTRLGRVKPALVTLDREQSIFIDKDEYVFYGYLDNDFSASQKFYTYFDVSLQLREAM